VVLPPPGSHRAADGRPLCTATRPFRRARAPAGLAAMEAATLRAPVRLAGRAALSAQSDERLVELARDGSEPAFEAIVQRYRGPLHHYSARIAPRSSVDDIVQHAFISAYRRIQDNGCELTLKPWLFRVAHNAALDALRREARGFEELDESMDGVERPDQALERKESLRALVSALGGLPERQRSAILLRELEGRSYQEIERELGLAGGALRQLLYRARTSLRTAASAITPPWLLVAERSNVPRAETIQRIGELASGPGAAAVVKTGALIAATGVIGAAAVSTSTGDQPAQANRDQGSQSGASASGASH
jgi:RNA polymerase sigma factor (sigma-70 family)